MSAQRHVWMKPGHDSAQYVWCMSGWSRPGLVEHLPQTSYIPLSAGSNLMYRGLIIPLSGSNLMSRGLSVPLSDTNLMYRGKTSEACILSPFLALQKCLPFIPWIMSAWIRDGHCNSVILSLYALTSSVLWGSVPIVLQCSPCTDQHSVVRFSPNGACTCFQAVHLRREKKGRGELNSQSENQRLVWEAKNFGNITPWLPGGHWNVGPKTIHNIPSGTYTGLL